MPLLSSHYLVDYQTQENYQLPVYNSSKDFSIWISSDELIHNIAIVDILDNDTVDGVGGLMLNHVLQPVIQKKSVKKNSA